VAERRIEEEEIIAPEEEVAVPAEEGIGEGIGLGSMTVAPADVEGLADKKVGDTVTLLVDADVSDVDEDGNFTLSFSTARVSGEEVAEAGEGAGIAEAMVAGEEEV